MRLLAALVVCLILPAAALAGPWPREQGRSFLSFSYTARDDMAAIGTGVLDPSGYSAFYFEYGLGRRLTFGIDAGQGDGGQGASILFLRGAFGPPDRRLLTAWQIGLGYSNEASPGETLVQLGLSLGRGTTSRLGHGWLTLDTQVQHRLDTGGTVIKADGTYGVKPRPGTMLILQLQTGKYPGSDTYARLAPSYVRQIGPGVHLEAGAEFGLLGEGSAALKLGTWFEF